jgi:hypothetical protein
MTHTVHDAVCKDDSIDPLATTRRCEIYPGASATPQFPVLPRCNSQTSMRYPNRPLRVVLYRCPTQQRSQDIRISYRQTSAKNRSVLTSVIYHGLTEDQHSVRFDGRYFHCCTLRPIRPTGRKGEGTSFQFSIVLLCQIAGRGVHTSATWQQSPDI